MMALLRTVHNVLLYLMALTIIGNGYVPCHATLGACAAPHLTWCLCWLLWGGGEGWVVAPTNAHGATEDGSITVNPVFLAGLFFWKRGLGWIAAPTEAHGPTEDGGITVKPACPGWLFF